MFKNDEEDYDQESSGDLEQDYLAFTIRLLLRSGWIDTDESGDHLSALQTKRIQSKEDGWAELLKMLGYIKYTFDDIESYIQQLDEKNQTYIRITRQKLTYMLSMDTSMKGDIATILRDAKNRPENSWRKLSECINLFDIRQVMEGSFYHPRKRHVRNSGEELSILAHLDFLLTLNTTKKARRRRYSTACA